MSKISDISVNQAVDLSNLGTIIRERREALGLTHVNTGSHFLDSAGVNFPTQ